jgi:Tol biopolymer transport system component
MRHALVSVVLLAVLAALSAARGEPESYPGQIVYSSWAGQSMGIRVADPEFRNDRALASVQGRDQIHPVLSPDGKRVAFSSPNPTDPDDLDLYTMNADGSALKKMVEDAALPAWSPDGGRLLYAVTHVPPTIGIVNADGANAHAIPVRKLLAVAPFWSPDGRRIAFTAADRPDPRTADVFVASPDGAGVERLTSGAKIFIGGAGAWSPDGTKMVLFAADMSSRQGELQLWDVARKEHRRLADLGTTLQTKDFRLEATNALQMACWSPDGRALLATRVSTQQNRPDIGLFLLSPDGGVLKRLTPQGVLCFNGNWSACR